MEDGCEEVSVEEVLSERQGRQFLLMLHLLVRFRLFIERLLQKLGKGSQSAIDRLQSSDQVLRLLRQVK